MHDQGAIERIRVSYEARGIEYTARGERMARIVKGARVIPNPVGLATGMMLQEGGTLIVTFPGIPVEMKAMFDGFVAPIIEERAPTKFVSRTLTARVKFLEFFPIYRQMHVDYPDVYIKNAATPPESREGMESRRDIRVDIVAEGGTRELSEGRMEEVVSDFRDRIEKKGGLLLEDST
jgi:molybdopterin-biosynthesis enzyme MoeA-like protein